MGGGNSRCCRQAESFPLWCSSRSVLKQARQLLSIRSAHPHTSPTPHHQKVCSTILGSLIYIAWSFLHLFLLHHPRQSLSAVVEVSSVLISAALQSETKGWPKQSGMVHSMHIHIQKWTSFRHKLLTLSKVFFNHMSVNDFDFGCFLIVLSLQL